MGHRKGLKLKAYLPIAKTSITEIGSLPDQGAAEFLNRLKESFLVRQGYYDDMKDPFDVDFSVYGKKFKYEALYAGLPPVPIRGTIKKVDVEVDGVLGLEISKLHLSVPDAAKLWAKDDPLAAFAALLTGDDTIIGSDDDDPNLWGGKGNDRLWGRMGDDIVNGFKGNDVNDGGEGNDRLVDTKGDDSFSFTTKLDISASLNLNFNFDTIRKFGKGDEIYLAEDVFEGIGGKLNKGEFHFGDMATSAKHRILFDGDTGYWDRDGSGTMYEAIPFFEVENGGGKINHKVFVMGVMYGDDY